MLALRSGVEQAQELVPSHPTLGVVDSPEALAQYQAEKRAHKGRASRESLRSDRVTRSARASAVRVGLGVALVLSLPLLAMLVTDEVVWSLADVVVAGALLATIGVVLELAARRAGGLAVALGVAVLGVAAAVLGKADDAPGLVLLGIVLVAGAGTLGVRAKRAT